MERRVLIGYWSRKKEDHDAIAWRISRYQRRTKKSKKDTLFEHSTATVFGDFALIRGCGIRRSFERGEHTVARRGREAHVNQRSNKQPWVIHGKVSPQPIATRETEGESAAVGRSVGTQLCTNPFARLRLDIAGRNLEQRGTVVVQRVLPLLPLHSSFVQRKNK